MKPVIREFETRDALELAYHDGKLNQTELYRVVNSPFQYRLSPIRKGLIQIPLTLDKDHA